jgi:hypothetical protein
MSKLFEDAIAEAKQLRELAEQNAKNAIVEAVTPRIREFIEEQLLAEEETPQYEELADDTDTADVLESVVDEIMSEMASEDDDAPDLEETAPEDGDLLTDADADAKETEEPYELDEDAMQMLSKMLNERSDLTPSEQKLKGIVLAMHKLKTRLPGMNESQRAEVQKIISQVKSHLLTNEGKMLENEMVEVDLDKGETEVDSLTMEEITDGEDVEEALNELRLLLDLGDADEEGAFDMDAITVSDADMLDADEDAEGADAEDADAELEFELEDDEVPLDAAPEGEDMELDDEAPELDDEELEISEEALVTALREMKNTRVTASTTARTRNTNKTNGSAQIATLSGQVAEYAKVINSLREQLTEMNLFNAKLLYVNKLVQDKNVTSEQRRGIVESLDGAKTLREVKLLYKGLTKSLKTANTSTKKGQISESAARRSIGSSSRPAGMKSTQKSLNESGDNTTNRWATLAGLK